MGGTQPWVPWVVGSGIGGGMGMGCWGLRQKFSGVRQGYLRRRLFFLYFFVLFCKILAENRVFLGFLLAF